MHQYLLAESHRKASVALWVHPFILPCLRLPFPSHTNRRFGQASIEHSIYPSVHLSTTKRRHHNISTILQILHDQNLNATFLFNDAICFICSIDNRLISAVITGKYVVTFRMVILLIFHRVAWWLPGRSIKVSYPMVFHFCARCDCE